MIHKVMIWCVPWLAMLAVLTFPIFLGALFRLLLIKVNRKLPALLAASVVLALEVTFHPGTLGALLSIAKAVSPGGNIDRSIATFIILIADPLLGLLIPFVISMIGVTIVDRFKTQRKTTALT